MQDPIQLIEALCSGHGIPGREANVAEVARKMFEPYCDKTWVDKFGNAYGVIGETGPKVFMCAHSDEVGMMATEVDDGGFIRFERVGGVDPRVLPGSEVLVHGRETLFGVIGATPPHLQEPDAQKKLFPVEKLRVDIGYPVEKARQLVRPGDMITFLAPVVRLDGGHVAAKSQDDRAGIVAMVLCMEELSRMKLNCQAVFCATISEEIGLKGGTMAGWATNPDAAIVLEVTHGPCPGSGDWETTALNKLSFGTGPNIHPRLLQRIRQAATEMGIDHELRVFPGGTPTDASAIQVMRKGIPCALLELPLKYMHTTVETLNVETLRKAGKVMTRYLSGITAEGGAV